MARLIGPVVVVGAALAALLLPPRAALAWGPQGHRVIALIADRALQQSDAGVRATVLALLASDKGDRLAKPDIASQATWADVSPACDYPLVVPSELLWRNPEDRELYLSGLRLAMGEDA